MPANPGPGRALSIHTSLGIPRDSNPSDDFVIDRPQYVLSYNDRRHDPNWVATEVNSSWYGKLHRYKGEFMPDPLLPESFYHVTQSDYRDSGYDRGHLARSEERTRNEVDNKATFYTTNIVPQTHALNAGPWLRLEEYNQQLAERDDAELFVVAGPIFAEHPGEIGHQVEVPTSCFKIVVVLRPGQGAAEVTDATRVIAVIMPNQEGILDEGWGRYRTSVSAIEHATGYTFLNDVSPAVLSELKDRVDSAPLGR